MKRKRMAVDAVRNRVCCGFASSCGRARGVHGSAGVHGPRRGVSGRGVDGGKQAVAGLIEMAAATAASWWKAVPGVRQAAALGNDLSFS